MSYDLILSDGSVLVSLGTVEFDSTTTSLVLGGYATERAARTYVQNFVWLLENGASAAAPTSPLTGQIWFNETTSTLNVYSGSWSPLATQAWVAANGGGSTATDLNTLSTDISDLQASALTASSNLTSNTVTVNSSNVALGTELSTLATGLGSAQTALSALTASQAQSYVLAAPSGAAGSPSYRQLSAADITSAVSTTALSTAISALSRTVHVVTTGASATMAVTDTVLKIAKTTPSATAVTLPVGAVVGQYYSVKDAAGNAQTYPITVSAASGLIDGSASVTLNVAWQSVTFAFDGSAWSVV